MLKVHTFYERVPSLPSADKLLDLWKKNWTEHGFDPVVLSLKDAQEHPGYNYFLDRIMRFPTSNPREYERNCFLRHLAMANVASDQIRATNAFTYQPFLLVDYDVFTRINPNDSADRVIDGDPLLLEPTRVPCAVWATQEGYEKLCDILCEYQPKGEKHVSDMTILRKTQLPADQMCVEHLCSGRPIENDPGDGWKKAPMIHFSNYSFSKLGWRGDKAELIQRVLATL